MPNLYNLEYYRPYWKYFRMDGVFMKKLLKRIAICFLIVVLWWLCTLLADRLTLRQGLIRFHVVANSDSTADQAIKENVRDAVLASIQDDIRKIADIEEAKDYLTENLPKLQNLVDHTLQELGYDGSSSITLCKEAFDVRHYATFSLPAGVYDSLRIVIGEGMGKNWWCVSFPTLCIPATSEGFSDIAVDAGFSKPLTQALSGNSDYEIHFYFLNQLGKLENFFFAK